LDTLAENEITQLKEAAQEAAALAATNASPTNAGFWPFSAQKIVPSASLLENIKGKDLNLILFNCKKLYSN
jgi:hypothetical protein